LVKSFYALFDLLTRFPSMGKKREDLRRYLRSYPVGEHLVVYRVKRAELEIAHVVHQTRDLRKLYPERN